MNRLKRLMSFTLLLLALNNNTVTAAPDDFSITVEAPRDYGYMLGDTLALEVLIDAPMFARIETNRLPEPGFVNSWLHLNGIDIDEQFGDSPYRLTIRYQLFKAVKQNRTLTIPAMPISFKQASAIVALEIPSFSFSYHPVSAQARDDQLKVQAELAAPNINNPYLPAYYPLLAMALLLLYLTWFYGRLPWFERYAGAFGDACKTLAQLKRRPLDQAVYQQALQRFHGAINTVNGGTLFGNQLDTFFTEHPHFLPLQAQTELVFSVSRQQFFESVQGLPDQLTLSDLESLCLQYRKLERGGRWL